ncbi:MAG: porin [Hyphomicrobium sp.]
MAVLSLGLAGTVLPSTAGAADLGGNCCADLEERIAELEATTVRKGSRKVSLELSGHVNEAIMFWDDGGESNAYIVTNDNARTRFRFKGKAKIDADWEAGYQIEIGVRAANSKRSNQDNDEGNDFAGDVGFDMRDSHWFLRSKTYGTTSLGLQGSATDAITEINLTQTKDFSKYSDIEDSGLGMLLRSARNGNLTTGGINARGQTGLTWRRLIGDGGDQPGEGERRYKLIKYESPALKGFNVSGAWGEDDFWDVAIRYNGDFAGFKLAAGFGYGKQTDGPDTQTACNASIGAGVGDAVAVGTEQANQECHQYGGSIAVLHEATGLFVNLAAGEKIDDLIEETQRFQGTNVDDGQQFWAIQAGIEKKFIEHGKTTIYGEYYDYEGGGNSKRFVTATDALNPTGIGTWQVWATGVEMYGAGIAQGFDKAALTLYLSYRHYEADLTLRQRDAAGVANGAIENAPLEDLDVVMSGGIIKF